MRLPVVPGRRSPGSRRRAHSLAATVRGSHCASLTPALRLHAFNARCACPGGGVRCEDLGWLAVSLHPCTPFSRSMSAACLRHLRVYGQVTAQGRLVFGGRGAPHHLWSRCRTATLSWTTWHLGLPARRMACRRPQRHRVHPHPAGRARLTARYERQCRGSHRRLPHHLAARMEWPLG